MHRPLPDPATAPRDPEPHPLLVCTRCGAVVEIEGGGLEPPGESLARRLGFEVSARRLQLFGRCAACRTSPGRAPAGRGGRA